MASGTIRIAREDVPWTPRAERALNVTVDEAKELGTPQSGDVEHLLLALLKEREAGAAQILANFGVDYEAARKEILAVLEDRRKGQESGNH